jgi:hypothetical protein
MAKKTAVHPSERVAASRIYVVNDSRHDPLRNRLVRAANRAQALRHVAQDSFNVEVATQNTLVFLVGQGVPVEDCRPDGPDAEHEGS